MALWDFSCQRTGAKVGGGVVRELKKTSPKEFQAFAEYGAAFLSNFRSGAGEGQITQGTEC
jgi:hypothetical protein